MDLDHQIGADLVLSVTGGINTVSGTAEGQQRVLRRLLTGLRAYLWHTDYGAGLASYLGGTINNTAIINAIRAQMALEKSVVQSPPPSVSLRSTPEGYVVAAITYVDSTTGDTSYLTLPVV